MKNLILDTIQDLVKGFVDYDRKDDEELLPGIIEDSVKNGTISIEEMVDCFKKSLEEELK